MSSLKKCLISSVILLLVFTLCTSLAFAAGKEAIVNGNRVNIREDPGTDAKILVTLEKGTKVAVVGTSGDWSKVQYKNTTGWMLSGLLNMTGKSSSSTVSSTGTGTVKADILNVREKADTSADIVDKLKKGERVTILGKSGNWLKIKTPDGKQGWVAAEYITRGNVSSTSSTASRGDDVDREEADSADMSLAQKIVAYAKRYVGTAYVYGGDSPSEGFDCSGFTKYVFKHYGITLDRTAADQASNGDRVSRDNLQAGDLVLFDTNGGRNHINHVGIYIGGGKFIHAASPRYDVTISSLSEDFYAGCYMTARRVIG